MPIHIKYESCNLPLLHFRAKLLQSLTTLRGIDRANGKMIIKLRSDEHYTNIGHLVELYKQDSRFIVTNSLLIKGHPVPPYTICDHVWFAKAEILKGMCKRVMDEAQDYALTPEQAFGKALLQEMGHDLSIQHNHLVLDLLF